MSVKTIMGQVNKQLHNNYLSGSYSKWFIVLDFKADCYKASTYFKVKNGKVESHRSGEFSVINQSKGKL